MWFYDYILDYISYYKEVFSEVNMGNYHSIKARMKNWEGLEDKKRKELEGELDQRVREVAKEHGCWDISVPRKGWYDFKFYMLERDKAEEFYSFLKSFDNFSEVIFLTSESRAKERVLDDGFKHL